MTIKELRGIIEVLEISYSNTRSKSSNNPHDTARQFIRYVGADTAAQCVAAMIRRLSWDGRVSRTARQWAEGVSLSGEWLRRIDEAYTDRIHAAHLSQIAEAMPAELEHAAAEAQTAAERYLEQVEQADSLKRLWNVYQAATNDDTVSAAQCSTIYRAAALQAGKLDESRGVRL